MQDQMPNRQSCAGDCNKTPDSHGGMYVLACNENMPGGYSVMKNDHKQSVETALDASSIIMQ